MPNPSPRFVRSFSVLSIILGAALPSVVRGQGVPAPANQPSVTNPVAPINGPGPAGGRRGFGGFGGGGNQTADRQHMFNLLHLALPTNLPPDADDPNRPPHTVPIAGSRNWDDGVRGSTANIVDTVVRSEWGTWANYDLTKADLGPLPDPLVLKNGQPVTDAATWVEKRRPEIESDFHSEVYGKIPDNMPGVTWTVTRITTNTTAKTITKTVVGHVDNSSYTNITVNIGMTVTTPIDATGPVPVIFRYGGGAGGGFGGFGRGRGGAGGTNGFGGRGFGGTNGPGGTNGFAGGAGRGFGGRGGFGGGIDVNAEILKRGWGYGTFDNNSVQPGNGAGLRRGIIGLMNKGEFRKPDDWGGLMAWAWGFDKCLDYLETDKDVDAHKIALEGHSFLGKATIVAMAFDQRLAIAYPSCSGETGAKLHRHNVGESVENTCSDSEYYEVDGNFLKYAGHVNDLPVDSHELIALCAPRPVFVTGGTEDLWSDPVGEFKACVAAGPVYKLLGKKDLGTTEMPAPDTALIDGDIGFREHIGGHTDALDWPAFLQYCDKYFNTSAPAK